MKVSFLCLIILNLIHSSFAEESPKQPSDCVTTLMSAPSCIDKLNATNICKIAEGDEAFIKSTQDCVVKAEKESGKKSDAIAICNGKFSKSSDPASKLTFCNENAGKDVKINDSNGPKKIALPDVKNSLGTKSIQK